MSIGTNEPRRAGFILLAVVHCTFGRYIQENAPDYVFGSVSYCLLIYEPWFRLWTSNI